jgi:hypothetical protein
MSQENEQTEGSGNREAWIVALGEEAGYESFTVRLDGEASKYRAIEPGHWLLIVDPQTQAVCAGRILRIRSRLYVTYLYLDKALSFDPPISSSTASLSLPSNGRIGRLQWTAFAEAIPALSSRTLADVPLVEDSSYVRVLLQHAVMDDLLGPANGPEEHIVDMSVRDRYLVGKLAPQMPGSRGPRGSGGGEGIDGLVADSDTDEEAIDLEPHTGRHDPGSDFDSATGRIDGEADAADEVDASNNQSLVPSSFGVTFCVDGDAESLEVVAEWGRYERLDEHEHTRKRKDPETGEETEVKCKAWQRIPSGGSFELPMVEGLVSARAPDPDNPEVVVQGHVRKPNENGDRLVTLFLVNAQEEPETNRDVAWLFQPELRVTAFGDEKLPIFRKRPVPDQSDDKERASLEMVYRKQVEFAVGHGISVHAKVAKGDWNRATVVGTTVLPEYEVPVTETPGLDAEDRPAMRRMLDEGYLDMLRLAELDQEELVTGLSILTNDYEQWIGEQRRRVGTDVIDHDDSAHAALGRCDEVLARLREGVNVLAKDTHGTALRAFRLANEAMALQRLHSIMALKKRRGEKIDPAEIKVPKNHSWRPFQLAFLLLSLPALADPLHKDRTKPVEAYADLLWFPTGGGKTEAYLGVAAFTMFVRRLQGDLGGLDSSRGLSVVMRYTLRLLTLQQFQRATTLICAMEFMRRKLQKNGDETLGSPPFTIGLWVGNKVTPGTTAGSAQAIRDIRDTSKWDAGSTSPAQLTSCPWCGCEVDPARDIEVDTSRLRTSIYCGDKKGRCAFTRKQSADQPHPGIPALVVDEEIYHRPPSMMIATVDKFAMMAWRGEARTLFGRADSECPRHGLLWQDASCNGEHRADSSKGLPAAHRQSISAIRPPDLIIQDEFHLISGPLGTMVGLYETAVDELCTWHIDDAKIKPKVVASTATVRKADEQVHNVFMRNVSVFPPHGLDIEDNFFSVQRPIDERPGRRYLGVCSPGSSRPAVLIRVYTALLTAAQALFDRFGSPADPYMTTVGYFNSLRELGGMKRLSEDDVQTRSYRVEMSRVDRPGLAQRSVRNIRELTSRVSSRDIPKYLDQLEIKFKARFDPSEGKFITEWDEGETRAIDVVLATNMLSVGVDVNRLGLMAVNGQPKGTAEYIQATSRVGRQYPGLVVTVLTWAKPRDLSHYETFEHYHATFYKHVEAQSVTPFSPRAMDRGLTGTLVSILRLENDPFNPNPGAAHLDKAGIPVVDAVIDGIVGRAWQIRGDSSTKSLATAELKERIDEWAKEANVGGRDLGYEKRGTGADTMVGLLHRPGNKPWQNFTVPMSMREVEPGVGLIMLNGKLGDKPSWAPRPPRATEQEEPLAKTQLEGTAVSTPMVDEYFADLSGRDLKGESIETALPGSSSKHTVRFLRNGDEKPPLNSSCVVYREGLKQPGVAEGFAYGKIRWKVLQDPEAGKSLVNVTIRRPGTMISFDMETDEWQEFTGFGIVEGLRAES